MPTVRIPTPLRTHTGGASEVSTSGESVGEVLRSLARAHPGIEEPIFDDTGQLRRFVNIFLGEQDIRNLEGLETPVEGSETISIIPAIAGGSRA